MASSSTRLGLREIVHEAVQLNNGNTTSRNLPTTSKHSSDGPCETRSYSPVHHESPLMLTFQASLVLPWCTFWVCSELTETVGNPWVTLEILLQPVNVLDFHLRCGNGCGSRLKNFIGFLRESPHPFILHVIESVLSEVVMVRVIKLTRHLFFSTLLFKSCEGPLFCLLI